MDNVYLNLGGQKKSMVQMESSFRTTLIFCVEIMYTQLMYTQHTISNFKIDFNGVAHFYFKSGHHMTKKSIQGFIRNCVLTSKSNHESVFF